jgi:hypothetical protein
LEDIVDAVVIIFQMKYLKKIGVGECVENVENYKNKRRIN